MFHCLNFSKFWDVDYKREKPLNEGHIFTKK